MKKISILFLFIFLASIYSFAQQHVVLHPSVIAKAVYFDVSPPLRDLPPSALTKADMTWKDGVVKNRLYPFGYPNYNSGVADPIRRDKSGMVPTDTTIQNFDGTGGNGSLCPPDTYGEVGASHYFEVVNCQYAVYDKNGVKLMGPTNNSNVWNGMPHNENDGDGTINYDEVHDRWIFSQFSVPSAPYGPGYQMVAVSQTNDPTGSWYRYQFQFNDMNDYPKLGVWPDGIYMSFNQFNGNFQGPAAVAMEYNKMLTGDPDAQMVVFTLPASVYCIMPADCDGAFPPAGTPEYFMDVYSSPQIKVWEFQVDWTTPSNSTFTQKTSVPITPFTGTISGGIPQKGTGVKLDPLAGRLMYRLQFRKFNDHWSIVGNFTVNADGSGLAGIRWFELRSTGTDWSLYQEGTFSPDNNCRWMGSVAMDSTGNMALGYSVSSSTVFPSIRYTGRMNGDPLGEMTLGEMGIINGGGSQTNTWSGSPSRWGDYSGMSIDPTVAKKFWYTQEYYSTSSQANWKTRIASFSFANIFMLSASASPQSICTGGSSTLDAGATGGSGTYTYSWTSIPAGFTSTQANPVVSPTANTQYVCAVNDGTQTKHDTTQVGVHAEPTAFAGNDTTYAITLPLYPAQGHATDYSSVKWTTAGDGWFSADTVLTPLYHTGWQERAAGLLTLTLTAYPIPTCTNAASDDINVTFSPAVGISEITGTNFDISLFPNPAQGTCRLTIQNLQENQATVTILDMTGRQVYSDVVAGPQKSAVKNLDLRNMGKGIYFVRVRTDSGSRTEKMIVQ